LALTAAMGSGNAALVDTVVRLLVYAKKKHGAKSSNGFLSELSKQQEFPMQLNHVLAAYARGLKAAAGSWTEGTYVTEAQELLHPDNR